MADNQVQANKLPASSEAGSTWSSFSSDFSCLWDESYHL